MQKLGQHFLKNKAALRLIAEALALKPGKSETETVIEIGPGHGELTEEIRKQSFDIKIIAIEKDPILVKKLREKFINDEKIQIIEGDALKLLKNIFNPNFKIAGNIPYYITGHLLRTISELEHKPELCIFTIQKEVAERIIATPPRMNRLAASVQFWAEPKILKILPAGDFSPPPKVDSAIIRLAARDGGDKVGELIAPEKYYAAVRTVFAQPRKTILNNLSVAIKNKEGTAKILEKIGIKPNARPQDLTVEDIKAIAERF